MLQKGLAQTCTVPGKDGVLSGATTAINTYYPGLASLSAGANRSIPVGTATGTTANAIVAGDLVLIIQMQGANLNTANDNTYGTTTNITAGVYEYALATSGIVAGAFTVANLVNSYTHLNFGTQGQARYQVIRVPQYSSATLGATLTCPAWNGTTGGVVVIEVAGSLHFNGQTIDVSGKGFRGGAGRSLNGGAGTRTDYRTLSSVTNNAQKGEGLAGSPAFVFVAGTAVPVITGNEGYPNGSNGRGAASNAGGGGNDGRPAANDENAGGGGGANGGSGGGGGNTWNSNSALGGISGKPYPYVPAVMPFRLLPGGGGGAGTTNNASGNLASGLSSSGAAGGGLVLLRAGQLTGSGTILANGSNADNTVLNDGSGGGGGGGAILITAADAGLQTITVSARGGNGGSNTGGGSPHGPGGGGGGGIILANGTLNSFDISKGVAGTTFGAARFGATDGADGIVNTALTRPVLVAPAGANCPPSAIATATDAISNTAPASAIRMPVGYDMDGTIASYRLASLPPAAQGVLYVNGIAAALNRNYTPAEATRLTFDPAVTFFGNAGFTFNVTDNAGTAAAGAAIYTIPVRAAPAANNITAPVITNNLAATPISPLSATDADGSIASYTLATLPPASQGLLWVNAALATLGQVITPAQGGQLAFDPAPDFFGVAAFTFTATDNTGFTDLSPAVYSIPVNDAPVASNVTSDRLTRSNTVRSTLTPLKAADADGNVVSYRIVSLPRTSGGALLGALYTSATGGTQLQAGDIITTSQLYYLPTNNNTNADDLRTFTYAATDNQAGVSNTATYTLVVNTNPSRNAADMITAAIPNTAGPTAISGLEATGGTITRYRLSSLPTAAQGILYINGGAANTTTEYTLAQAAQLTFDPAATFSGTASFTFTATTSTTTPRAYDTTPATYSIPVYAGNPAVYSSPNVYSIYLLSPGMLLTQATDADGAITSAIVTGTPLPSFLTLNQDGSITVNSQPAAAGTYATTVTTTDAKGGTSVVPVSVTITNEAFQANNNAVKMADNCYQLTAATNNQRGEVWKVSPIDLDKSFDINFNIYLGANDNGADGIAFALQRQAPNPLLAAGQPGEGLGIGNGQERTGGVAPSLAVEFDTYQNTAAGGTNVEPAADHIAIFLNGEERTPVANAVQMSATSANTEDGLTHAVKIIWRRESNTLYVYFDGVLRTSYTGNITSTVFGNNPLVYFGYTASTGGSVNVHQVCEIAYVPLDADKDGLADLLDLDDDNDGLPDLVESAGLNPSADDDQDGLPNYRDSSYPGFADGNSDGINDRFDRDLDGIINALDLDADGDGIPDAVEANAGVLPANMTASGQFPYDYVSANDTDQDGLANDRDVQNNGTPFLNPDTDGDQLKDFQDLDADNDGIPDNTEAQGLTPVFVTVPADANRDGLDDKFDASCGCALPGTTLSVPYQADADAVPDYLDLDSDNDGLPDQVEAFDLNDNAYSADDWSTMGINFTTRAGASPAAAWYSTADTDGNGLPDWLEANGQARPGFLRYGSPYYHDSNQDGWADLFDASTFGTPVVAVNPAYRLAMELVVLPVALLDFRAAYRSGKVNLTWSTAMEKNNHYFEVQRSRDGLVFGVIGQVAGAGSSSHLLHYQFTDAHTQPGLYFYRLRQVDLDGTAIYTRIVAVAAGGQAPDAGGMRAYPNPATTTVTLAIPEIPAATTAFTLELRDVTGKLVRQNTFVPLAAGAYTLDLAQLPAGVYLVQAIIAGRQRTTRLVKGL